MNATTKHTAPWPKAGRDNGIPTPPVREHRTFLGPEKRHFDGVVGRESSSKGKHGHQGVHHHPMKAQLGQNVAGGIKPGARRMAGKSPC
ncbi:MAG: hypothetical protein JO290_10765 [Sphingomonadaceae bacterium]|nr:hypothetical protein [Sphingomonadaceae bacterium]